MKVDALDLLLQEAKKLPEPKLIIVSPKMGAELFGKDPDILGLDILRVDPFMPDDHYLITSKNVWRELCYAIRKGFNEN